MVSPKLHESSIRHVSDRDRPTQIVPVGLDTQYQIRDVVRWYAWARDRVERMKLAEENFDKLPVVGYPPAESLRPC